MNQIHIFRYFGFIGSLILITFLFSSCSQATSTVSRMTPIIETKSLTATSTQEPDIPFTPTITATITPQPTMTLPPTIVLGSPFGNCGDGIPRIWSNDSYNGLVPDNYESKMDQNHGHVDIMRPKNCDRKTVYAPADGYLRKVGNNNYDLLLDLGSSLMVNPNNPPEFQKALSGILSSTKSNQIILKLAHFSASILDGPVIRGQEIGELVMEMNHWKIAYQITTNGNGYQIWSPTLFMWDPQPVCINDSPYDCIPEIDDYAP